MKKNRKKNNTQSARLDQHTQVNPSSCSTQGPLVSTSNIRFRLQGEKENLESQLFANCKTINCSYKYLPIGVQ
jgi:hypothetical protein